MTRKFLPCRRG